MKRLLLFTIIAITFLGCDKDENAVANSYELATHPSWKTEEFKREYLIQFPIGYAGGIIHGFEGNMFEKRNLPSDLYYYGYSNNIFFADFRDTLTNVSQATYTIIAPQNTAGPVLLDKKLQFMLNNQLVGIFYHNGHSTSVGRLFWKDDGVFKEAMDVYYDQAVLPTVIEVIRTIKRK